VRAKNSRSGGPRVWFCPPSSALPAGKNAARPRPSGNAEDQRVEPVNLPREDTIKEPTPGYVNQLPGRRTSQALPVLDACTGLAGYIVTETESWPDLHF
jgi:hypothetical protein